jgi:predicted ATPase
VAHPLFLGDLVEREAELSACDSLLDAARGGRGSLLVIEGPAGIGKTRLIHEARARAEATGMHPLGARGGELERDFPFGVVRQLFEPLVASCADRERDQLLSGAARFAERALSDRLLERDADGDDASYATLHGLYWLAANVADRSPLLIAVDDAHWSDAASQHSLAYLIKRIEDLPALILLTMT